MLSRVKDGSKQLIISVFRCGVGENHKRCIPLLSGIADTSLSAEGLVWEHLQTRFDLFW